MEHVRRTAFSLLELLVIIAIIALLMAILLPSLSRAREQSRRARCAANLRSLTWAWHAYLDANGGHFLQYTNANNTYGGKQGSGSSLYRWPKTKHPLNRQLALDPRVARDAEVFHCPADIGTTATAGATSYDYVGTSYYTNDLLIGENKPQAPFPDDPCMDLKNKLIPRLTQVTRGKISNESRLLLIGDAAWYFMQKYNSTSWLYWHGRKYFHNLGFMDGHVAFIEIHKGLYVTPQYTVIPFRDLLDSASSCQQEVLLP